MPTTPKRARLWLTTKRAQVVKREPFTIRLRFQTSEYTQPATVGVDTGSQTVGLAALTNGEVVFGAEVHLRTDVSLKLTRRRHYRRNRRSRKTRYRAARFANRRRKTGWLPPSLRSKTDTTVKAVRFVASILPVGQVKIEIGEFDTQKMQHPQILGLAYQQGELHGYLLRAYLLSKWQRKCAYCGATSIPLQIEHLVPRARGGSDRVSNLTLACEPCNKNKGMQTALEFGFPDLQEQASAPLRDAAHVSSIKTAVVSQLADIFGSEQVCVTYGYETQYKRIQQLSLTKSHSNDAIAIACDLGQTVRTDLEVINCLHAVPRGQYQLFNGKHSEHRVWAPKKVKNWKLYELVEAKGQIGYIAARRMKGAFVIKQVPTNNTLLEVTPGKLVRLARPQQSWVIVKIHNQQKGYFIYGT